MDSRMTLLDFAIFCGAMLAMLAAFAFAMARAGAL